MVSGVQEHVSLGPLDLLPGKYVSAESGCLRKHLITYSILIQNSVTHTKFFNGKILQYGLIDSIVDQYNFTILSTDIVKGKEERGKIQFLPTLFLSISSYNI